MKPTYLDLDTGFRRYDEDTMNSLPSRHSCESRNPVRIAATGVLLLLLSLLAPLASADIQPLPPDQVYKVSTSAEPGTITVHWDILPGYYLYKSKFKFVSHVTGIKLGEAQLPAGEIKEDPYFGKQEIYHKGVSVKLPYQGVGKLDLELIYQGCFEKGFCYPPQHRHVNVELVAASLPTAPPPAPATKTATPAASSAVHPQDLAALVGGAGTGDEGNFLKPDEAFIFSAVAKDQNTLELRWKVAPGYYLYRQKFHLASDNPDVQLGTPDFPQGQIKNDPYMGTSEIYTQDVDALIPVTRSNGAGKFNLQASYQGCAEAGFCYPPIAKTEPIDLAVAPPMTGAAPAAAPPIAEQDRLAVLLQTGNLLIVMLTFLGVGMLLTFTPCVLPMIPIISGIIVGQGKKLTTAHAFALSLTYVLAMAVVYAVVGVVVGLLGSNIQLALQNPWVLGAFSAIFVALALSMFGLYDLQMPSAVQSWLTQHSNSQKSGVFVGAGIMGALSALICGPCITAPLVAALVFIGETHSALRGGLALFALGLGMGVPLLIIGTTEGRLLPKPGPWMNTVKAVFGVIMLGLAIWFLSRVIPGPLTLALCAALSLVCGIYLGALEPLHVHAPHTGWRTLWKGLGILAVLYGLIMLVGAAMGGDDPLKPLAPLARAATAATLPGQPAPANGLNFKRIKTTADLNAALAAASAAGKPAMLDFAADWCISCKELEHDTYTDAAVQAALSNVLLLQADWTAYDDADKALGQDLGVAGPPTVLFYGSDGKEIKNLRVVGLVNTDEFMSRLKAAYSNK